jgi:hypothetical protein
MVTGNDEPPSTAPVPGIVAIQAVDRSLEMQMQVGATGQPNAIFVTQTLRQKGHQDSVTSFGGDHEILVKKRASAIRRRPSRCCASPGLRSIFLNRLAAADLGPLWNRVTSDVEQQLLELGEFNSDTVARLPPSVGVEGRVTRHSNGDSRLVALQRSMEHSTYPP